MKKVLSLVLALALVLSCSAALASEPVTLVYAEVNPDVYKRQEYEQQELESALRVTVPRSVTPGAPLDRFSSMSEYSLVVYARGAAMLCACLLDTSRCV